MKTKKFEKKLALKKKTIANLSSGKLSHVKGGLIKTAPPCIPDPETEPSCQYTCQNTCQYTCQNTCPTVAEAAQCCDPTVVITDTFDCTKPGTPC